MNLLEKDNLKKSNITLTVIFNDKLLDFNIASPLFEQFE